MKLIFVMMPQDFDLDYIKKERDVYYKNFFNEIKKIIPSIDLADNFISRDLKELFIFKEHSKYYKSFSGHYGSNANRVVAEVLHKFIDKHPNLKC